MPDSEGILGFHCDSANAQLVLERQAVGVPTDVRLVTIEADGTRMDYPAERADTALAPVLVTPIALDALSELHRIDGRWMHVRFARLPAEAAARARCADWK